MLIDGARVEDSVDVLWLQGETWFVDVRTGFNGDPRQGWAFAGQIEWVEPKVKFHHLVDTSREARDDVGSFVFTDSGCSETGEVTLDGVAVPFEEKWIWLADSLSSSAFIATKDDQLIAVKVVHDRYVACVCDFGAAVYIVRDGRPLVQTAFTTSGSQKDESDMVLEYFASADWQLIEQT